MASSLAIPINSSLRYSIINAASTSISEILLSKHNRCDLASQKVEIANLYKRLRDEADDHLVGAIHRIEGQNAEIETDATIDEKIKEIAKIALRIGVLEKIENLNISLEKYQGQINNWGSGDEISKASVQQIISKLFDERELLINLSKKPDYLYETIC